MEKGEERADSIPDPKEKRIPSSVCTIKMEMKMKKTCFLLFLKKEMLCFIQRRGLVFFSKKRAAKG